MPGDNQTLEGQDLFSFEETAPKKRNVPLSSHNILEDHISDSLTSIDSDHVPEKSAYGSKTGAETNEDETLVGQEVKKPKTRKFWVIATIICLAIVLAVILIPVGVLVIKPKNATASKASSSSASSSSPSANSGGSSGSSGGSSLGVPSAAKGTVLDPSTWLDTVDFNTTYTGETVGGLSVMGLNSTWDSSSRANPRVPALDELFNYTSTPMRGVNLGGWLVLEPFITPSIFDGYSKSDGIVDEYTLSVKLNSENSTALKDRLEKHYSEFVTETTFKEIAEAGLDHIRIPYPYWFVKTYSSDPYLAQVGWRYLLRGIEWARKYGLRVVLDFHALPGSQNGYNHSGRQGYPHWLNGTQGQVYGNQSLSLHQQLATFFAQDRYKEVISMYGLANEPKMLTLNHSAVIDWTKQAYKVVRESGFNNSIVFSEGFLGPTAWPGIFPESEYPGMVMDLHQYTIFNTDNIALTHSGKLNFVCSTWVTLMSQATDTKTGHGPTIVGEWSQADTDCAKYLNAVNYGSRWTGTLGSLHEQDAVLTPSCASTNNCTCEPANADPSTYSSTYKNFLRQYAELQMNVFTNSDSWGFLYWTWQVEDAATTQWSYKGALEAGIMPSLAYEVNSTCSASTTDYEALGLPESY